MNLNNSMLEKIADFLVCSEDTATENEKTDDLDEDTTLEEWTADLLETAVDSDEEFEFTEEEQKTVVAELLQNKTTYRMLFNEFEELKSICL